MRRLDSASLFAALDAKRAAAGMTWREVAQATGVSEATLKRTRAGGRMEVDGMLAMVAWLGLPVEKFVKETGE